MNLEQFLTLSREHTISSKEAQNLNETLAKTSIQDIPPHHRGQVMDYLTTALNMDSVEQKLVAALELLLRELQTRT